MKTSVDGIVVTYNRLDKLKECVKNLIQLSLSKIIIVNNASTDSTSDFLNEVCQKYSSVVVLNLTKNVGGAGGFNAGMKYYIANSTSEFAWIMDDDTIPSKEALDKLLRTFNTIPENLRGFCVGNTLWTDGTPALMNIPEYASDEDANQRDREIINASFVAILFPRSTILKAGFPIKEFFIWGDDIEYTERIVRLGFRGVQARDATILHDMAQNSNTNIINENDNVGRIKRGYYDFRNRVFISRQRGIGPYLKAILGRFVWVLRICIIPNEHKMLKLSVLFKGTIAGLTFLPKIEKVKS